MITTRRGLAATALPLLMLGAGLRAAAAKSAGPTEAEDALAEACAPGAPSARCAAAKARFIADGGAAGGGCPHCAALSQGKG